MDFNSWMYSCSPCTDTYITITFASVLTVQSFCLSQIFAGTPNKAKSFEIKDSKNIKKAYPLDGRHFTECFLPRKDFGINTESLSLWPKVKQNGYNVGFSSILIFSYEGKY